MEIERERVISSQNKRKLGERGVQECLKTNKDEQGGGGVKTRES